ncbi:DUF3410 domain-containing protein, partial [Klebsiella pneumoniae]|uniref:DUF3410 domain-containing protein n=1 Tax=Klebsiella pneumoniae TaxID=573 RepID=UPI00272F6436
MCRSVYDPRRDDADFRRSLVGTVEEQRKAFDLLRKHYPARREIAQRTITLMSASKAYNVAGLKTCFAVIQNAEIRERFNNARCGMVDSVSPLG